MTTAAIEKKHKHFTMGAGTTYRHVGFWFPLTGKNAKSFPSYAQHLESQKPSICKGICDNCGTRIVYHHIIEDENGDQFVVGSECVKKLNDVELIEKSESIENESLKEQKNIIRELMDKKEREINGGLTNKEMRKKLLKEAEENKQEKRIAIASTIIDMIKTFRMRGNKKKAFWQYSDSAEVREMLKDSKYIPNNFFWDKLKEQFVFYYQTNVIGDNSEELNKKLADFEKAKEKFELDLSIIETEKMEEVEIIKKQYK